MHTYIIPYLSVEKRLSEPHIKLIIKIRMIKYKKELWHLKSINVRQYLIQVSGVRSAVGRCGLLRTFLEKRNAIGHQFASKVASPSA